MPEEHCATAERKSESLNCLYWKIHIISQDNAVNEKKKITDEIIGQLIQLI